MIDYNAVVCRYSEIAIKKGNRHLFEGALMDNMRRLLATVEDLRIRRVRGRIWLQHGGRKPFSAAETALIRDKLPQAFGLETFSPAIICEADIETIANCLAKAAPAVFTAALKETRGPVRFRVRARRGDKKFPLDSKGIEIALAESVWPVIADNRLSVDLTEAEITIGCEIRDEFAFLYFETLDGPGGLPGGSSSPVLALLSGGIDSPVACYLTMRRGCPVDYLTFHSSPYTPPETIGKVAEIAAILNVFQNGGTLYSCNLAPIQKLIRDKCSEKARTVLYRRMMMRIASALAKRLKLKALVTGEAIGQVASQTIVNMGTIDAATDSLILRPVLGMDKRRITDIARRIGTFETSKRQVPDSCTVFQPKSPSTNLPVVRAETEESGLGDFHAVLTDIIDAIEIVPLDNPADISV